MTSKEHQIRNSAYYLSTVLVGNVISFLTLPLFTRTLTPYDYGIFALAQVYVIFVSGIASFGLPLAYERNFFQYRNSIKESALFYSILLFVAVALIFFGIGTFFARSHISYFFTGSYDFGWLIFFAFCGGAVMSIKALLLIYYKNTEQAKRYFWYVIDETILGTILSLYFVIILRVGVIGLVIGPLIASVFVGAVMSFNFVKNVKPAFDLAILRESLRFSYPLTPRIFFGVIGSQFDKYILGLLSSAGGVGVYSMGQRFSGLVFTFMTSIQNVFAPQVYQRMFQMGHLGGKAVGMYLTPFAYISTFVALCVVLFSEEVVRLLTTEAFYGATDIVIVLAVMYAFMFFGKQPQLLYTKKTHITSILTIISIAIQIGITIPFVMQWGVLGAAWGTLCASIISSVISFVVSQYYYPIQWENGKIISIYSILCASAALMLFLRWSDSEYALRVVLKCMILSGYIILGIKLAILTREHFALVKKAVNFRVNPIKTS